MRFDFKTLTVGHSYSRDSLAEKWGYKGRQAISRGIVTPASDNKIILFVTKNKQKADTQYNDFFIEEGLLHMEGETSHFNDKRLQNAEVNNESIYLFYRNMHHTPFQYYGEVCLVECALYDNKPSTFILRLI
ncbi:hypothetical protein FZC83_08305 [Rossellomorea marisflavi]|uniref:Uncharacterized protein n=1 Tax=Rossellomorea marisflavi TaxID=189381 RepID=A0A5D4RX41_9BACI|nr:hypothetical protein [Rossellomorea marisflavi]TYS54941.1 hypothetical protein FZC83_08305 [Rossellomorea marisflavi]